MNIEEITQYCLAQAGAFECFPFDDDTMVFKVRLANGKQPMFALVSLSKPNYILLKCNPERAIELREVHEEIEPGFHMNKRHWNGVYTDGNLPRAMIEQLIDHSYNLVVKKTAVITE